MITALTNEWRGDGLELYAYTWKQKEIQFTFKAKPECVPQVAAQRIKGRLDRAFRTSEIHVKFSRKVTLRSLGYNTSDTVISYVRNQLKHVDLADKRYRDMLADKAIEDKTINLAQPYETNSGRYWYNLHIVFVVANRYRTGSEVILDKMQSACIESAQANNCSLKAVSLMPDHVHIALRGNITMSPQEIGLSFQNNLADAAGRLRYWESSFYVGSFSEYDLSSVERV